MTAVFEKEPAKTYTVTVKPNNANYGSVTGGGTYPEGETVTVKATAKPGYQFEGWQKNDRTTLFVGWQEGDSADGTNTSYTFTVSESVTLTAVFEKTPTYVITVEANNTNYGSVTGGGTYTKGTSVTVKATPKTGYTFTGWQKNGSTVSTSASYTFTASEEVTLTAMFEKEPDPTYTITVKANNSAYGSVSGSGTYTKDTSVTVKATPATGYTFTGWQKNGSTVNTSSSYTFTASEAVTLTAVFEKEPDPTYTITVVASPETYGTVTGGGTYTKGERVTVSATPKDGYLFTGWQKNGTTVSTSSSYTFSASGDCTLTAVFKKEALTITVETSPVGSGTVSGGGTYGKGTTVTVTATPNTGYLFTCWQQDGVTVSTKASYTFAADVTCTLTAVFKKINYTVTVSADSASNGSVTGGGTYPYETSVTVSATANPGHTFTGWRKADGKTIISTDKNYTFTVWGGSSLVAVFDELPIIEKYFPSEAFRSSISNQIDADGSGGLSQSEIASTTKIAVSCTTLEGIEYFPNLQELSCGRGDLTTLDVSMIPTLKELKCARSGLTSLDVSKNTALTYLDCQGNKLTSLDISKNPALVELWCFDNQLTSLNISKNTALQELLCGGNQLMSLDVSMNTALTYLDCQGNKLTSLDVSKNTALTSLSCISNNLTSLDVSRATSLESLSCSYNSLTSLNVSGATSLKTLYCNSNKLTTLDVTTNTALKTIDCDSSVTVTGAGSSVDITRF